MATYTYIRVHARARVERVYTNKTDMASSRHNSRLVFTDPVAGTFEVTPGHSRLQTGTWNPERNRTSLQSRGARMLCRHEGELGPRARDAAKAGRGELPSPRPQPSPVFGNLSVQLCTETDLEDLNPILRVATSGGWDSRQLSISRCFSPVSFR